MGTCICVGLSYPTSLSDNNSKGGRLLLCLKTFETEGRNKKPPVFCSDPKKLDKYILNNTKGLDSVIYRTQSF